MFLIFMAIATSWHRAASGYPSRPHSVETSLWLPFASLSLGWVVLNLTVYLILVYQLILISQSEMTGATE
jgi:hypothetical protein